MYMHLQPAWNSQNRRHGGTHAQQEHDLKIEICGYDIRCISGWLNVRCNMSVRCQEPFVTWAFTRTAEHCEVMTDSTVHGCTVVENKHVTMEGFLTYCERTLGHHGAFWFGLGVMCLSSCFDLESMESLKWNDFGATRLLLNHPLAISEALFIIFLSTCKGCIIQSVTVSC